MLYIKNSTILVLLLLLFLSIVFYFRVVSTNVLDLNPPQRTFVSFHPKVPTFNKTVDSDLNLKLKNHSEIVRDNNHEYKNQSKILNSSISTQNSDTYNLHRGGVIVLGMHRSGTSLLTGLLSKTGLFIGKTTDLMWDKGMGINKKGYFERNDVYRINKKILEEQYANWKANTTAYRNEKAINDFQNGELKLNRNEKAIVILNDPKNSPWVLKDPRLCLTLPFWLSVFKPMNLTVVFTYRHPVEVALSLVTRNNMSPTKGLYLWINYNLLAIKYSNNLCRVVTNNQQLLLKSKGAVDQIVEGIIKCGVPVPHLILQEDADEFIDPSLHRQDAENVHSNESKLIFPNSVCSQNQTSMIIIRSCKKEQIAFKGALDVYSALQSGEAFLPSYIWPIIPSNAK